MTMTDKTKDIPFAACNFGCEGFVELVPARESVTRIRTEPTSLAPTTTPARAPALLREETIRQHAIAAERVRERGIRDAAEPEQAELVEELVASDLELSDALTFLNLDLLSRCEQIEQLQRSGQ